MAANAGEQKSRTQVFLIVLLVLVGLLLLLVLLLGVYNLGRGDAFFSLPKQTAAAKKMEESFYELFGPEGFTVNLNDSNQRRYLKTGVVLAYEDEKLLEELERRQSQLRDTTITVLRRWTAIDLAKDDGLEKLRAELLDAVNKVLGRGEIKAIYFTDFIIQ